jgi:release factor H-coupled RctB family protein
LPDNYTLIANSKCWIEADSLSQLNSVSTLPGIVKVVGLPDLHPGKTPVGAVCLSAGHIHPFLLGNDIGCGMGLFESKLSVKKLNPERTSTSIRELDSLNNIPVENPYPEPCPLKDPGTLGGGNHFAELQAVTKIYNQDCFRTLRLDSEKVFLLVHTGSRDFGQRIYEEYASPKGIPLEDPKASDYLLLHDEALLWAFRNRCMSAKRVLSFLGTEGELKLDSFHNFLENRDGAYIHRKGAVSTLAGPVVIPGSRGTLSYIVKPADDTSSSLNSLSHGAGRKWPRNLCKGRLTDKYTKPSQLQTTKLKSQVVCHNKNLLYEEAPEAYKNITEIVDALVEAGLCEVVCSLRPLVTIKL